MVGLFMWRILRAAWMVPLALASFVLAVFILAAALQFGFSGHAKAQGASQPPASVTTGAPASPNSVRPPAGATTNTLSPALPSNDPSPRVSAPDNTLGTRSDSDVWRAIRQGARGNVAQTQKELGVMIQSEGEIWRVRHNVLIARYGGWFILGMLGLIVLFFLVRGRIRIEGGRTGRVMPRFSLPQRIIHWFMAALFVLLGLSGLVILFGKKLLLPLIGPSAFSALASASIEGHNLFGPLFFFGLVAMIITFIRGNGVGLTDLKWLVKGGGLFGGHASAGKYNFGQKGWFWLVVLVGLIISATGFVMLLPGLNPGRDLLQTANLVHGLGAVLFIAVGIGHAYIGSLGMEGALEAMTRGVVDENWAKEHHDLWYEQNKGEVTTDQSWAEVEAASGRVGQA